MVELTISAYDLSVDVACECGEIIAVEWGQGEVECPTCGQTTHPLWME